jgi:hypothetical protein
MLFWQVMFPGQSFLMYHILQILQISIPLTGIGRHYYRHHLHTEKIAGEGAEVHCQVFDLPFQRSCSPGEA